MKISASILCLILFLSACSNPTPPPIAEVPPVVQTPTQTVEPKTAPVTAEKAGVIDTPTAPLPSTQIVEQLAQALTPIERSPFDETPVSKAYEAIRPAIQTFPINPEEPTTVEASGGTRIHIPHQAFVDRFGRPVDGPIQFEVVEVNDLSGFVSAGLTTLSDGHLLMSNGMLFVDAKANGESLRLANGKTLDAAMPTMGTNPLLSMNPSEGQPAAIGNGFQLFTGDGKDWTPDPDMDQTRYLVPIPLKTLHPRYELHVRSCYRADESLISYMDSNQLNYNDAQYANTVIATKAFKDRRVALSQLMYYMSFFTNEDHHFDRVDCYKQKFNYDIFRVYLDHPDKPLWYLDSMAKSTYLNYLEDHRDELRAWMEEVNKHKQEYFSNWTDTNYWFDFTRFSLDSIWRFPLAYFPEENRSEFRPWHDPGVNMESPRAFELLRNKGYSREEAGELVAIHFQRKTIIDQLEREEEALRNAEKLTDLYETTSFSITRLGWINCDRFFNSESAGPANITVQNASNYELDFMDVSLVIPNLSARLSAFQQTDGSYSFTKDEGPYTKLPIGERAVVVGVSLQEGQLYFGARAITIEDGIDIDLNLRKLTTDQLRSRLDQVLRMRPTNDLSSVE